MLKIIMVLLGKDFWIFFFSWLGSIGGKLMTIGLVAFCGVVWPPNILKRLATYHKLTQRCAIRTIRIVYPAEFYWHFGFPNTFWEIQHWNMLREMHFGIPSLPYCAGEKKNHKTTMHFGIPSLPYYCAGKKITKPFKFNIP